MHGTQTQVGCFDFPYKLGLKVHIAFHLRHVILYLHVFGWLVNNEFFKLYLQLGQGFICEACAYLANGLEAFEVVIPAGEKV